MSKDKIKLEVSSNEDGFTIWATQGKDRRWIIDASTVLKDGTFDFDKKRFKKVRESCNHWRYKLIK